ncbi:MAG: XrtA-associated ATPase [Nitrospiraceae bacterium]|nr:XrtA-associated ATPase [Nitrospiraceae bacterium]
MYTSFFGLRTKPFQITPDPEFVLLSRTHRKAMTFLEYGIAETSGFLLVTGEVGTGKTTLIRTLMKNLSPDIILAHVNNTKIGPEQILALIADEFGIDADGKDKTRTLAALSSFLIEQHSLDRKCLLIIDEAQNLSTDVLEEIRLLSNLETDKHKLLQIMLAGQPEFSNTLARPELRQLRQRIMASCNLQPLSESETADYILHRLEVAGNRNAVEFEGESLTTIYNFSRGIPRLINISCDFILLTAFTGNTKRITDGLVLEVTGELEETNNYWKNRHVKPAPVRTQAGLQEIVSGLSRMERLMEKLLENVAGLNRTFPSIPSNNGVIKENRNHVDPYISEKMNDKNSMPETGAFRRQLTDVRKNICKKFIDLHVKKILL